MKTQFTILPLTALALTALGSGNAAAQPLCDEFISSPNCQVRIPMGSVAGPVTPQYRVPVPVQSDIMVNPGGTAVTILQQASPFLACTIVATPAAIARDLSASVATALTTFGGLVIPAAPSSLTPSTTPPEVAEFRARVAPAPPLTPAEMRLAAIDQERSDLARLEDDAFPKIAALYASLRTTLLANWRYSFASEPDANTAVTTLNTDLAALLVAPLPDLATIQILSKKMQDDLTKFYTDFNPAPGSALAAVALGVAANVGSVAANSDLLQGAATDFKKKVKQYSDFLITVIPITPRTTITLPMAPYRQKTVTETITCKDAVSGAQPFDSIIYTAYYEKTPIFDISAGAIMSFLPGRQVGAVSGPLAPGTPAAATSVPTSGPCGAFNPSETCLGVTSASRAQFMPAAFVEIHPMNFRCPWATNGEPRHPFGYVCSFGLAGGFSVNPNNGTGEAEFFEGVSFGIQRLALLFGIHNGHYQTFTDGYYVGEAVPTGTVARTERIWTNHFAIAISYRTVQR
jgi:hypothetical protein